MNIVILSCANTGNFGDDIILEGIRIKLFKEYPNVGGVIQQVLRINEGSIGFVNSNDFLIIGGGEILSCSDVLKQITKFNITIPYMFFSVGIGNEDDIRPYLDKLNPTMWYARTGAGLKILNNCGIKNAMVCIDPIFDCPISGRKPNGRIGLNIKNQSKIPSFKHRIAQELDRLIVDGIAVDLLSFNNQPRKRINYCGEEIDVSDCNDLELMQKIQALMKQKINIVSYGGKDALGFLDILSGYSGIVGERLHSAMAAYHNNIDFRIVTYHNKINKFLSMNNLESKAIGADPDSISGAIKNLYKLTVSQEAQEAWKGKK